MYSFLENEQITMYEWLKESIKQAEDGRLVKFDVED